MKLSLRFRRKASALITTLMVLVVLSIIVVAFMQSMSIEKMSAKSVKNKYESILAAEAGLQAAIKKLRNQITSADAKGVTYTTWAYYPDSSNPTVYYSAVTVGKPDFLNATNFLNTNNTAWLFSDSIQLNSNNSVASSVRSDPNAVSSLASNLRIDINKSQKNFPGPTNILVPWSEYSRRNIDGRIEVDRFAYWIDDESSRIDISAAGNIMASGNHLRNEGANISEVPLLNLTNESSISAFLSGRNNLLTEKTAKQMLNTADGNLISSNSFLITIHSRGYDLIQYGSTDAGSVALTGSRRLNLNWSELTNSAITSQTRVNILADFMEAGATNFLNPNIIKYLDGSDISADILRRIKETIAASIIDYRDQDLIPLQPANLANPSNLISPPPPVRLMNTAETPEPRFFGADLVPRINEVKTIWNATAADNQAQTTVQRAGTGPYTYTIPIKWQFELWNQSTQSIPARNYKIRAFYLQHIQSAAFGFGGDAIPPDTEKIFDLGSLSFAPGEVKVVTLSETFTSTGLKNRGTTWDSFRNFADLLDDEPDGHDRCAYVLFDPSSGEWLHATTYIDAPRAPTDGVNVAGIGNKGEKDGNRINDPRISPLRSFVPFSISGISYSTERDNASAKPGSIGTLNNQISSYNFQHLDFWFDRLKTSHGGAALNSAEITTIANSDYKSIGELGNIFDPSWVHPKSRGSDSDTVNQMAYKQGLVSGFRGGGSLRIGQPCGNINYSANSWILLDIFGINSKSASQFAEAEWHGKVNVNFPKASNLSSEAFTNIDLVFRLPNLTSGPSVGSATNFQTTILFDDIKSRLSAPAVASWVNARPFFSVGEISELSTWTNGAFYQSSETTHTFPSIPPSLVRVNRSDWAREEIFRRASNLLTTKGNSFRIYVIGQRLTGGVNQTNLQVKSTSIIEATVFFPMAQRADGVYTNTAPKILYFRAE